MLSASTLKETTNRGLNRWIDLQTEIRKKYCSRANQTRIHQYLRNLSIEQIGEQDDVVAFTKLQRRILKLFPLIPNEMQIESTRIELLRNTVIGKPSSPHPISRLETVEHPTMEQFLAELQGAAVICPRPPDFPP